MFSWIISPFETWNAVVVVKWYFAAVVLTLLLASILSSLGFNFSMEKLYEVPISILILLGGFLIPFLEEVIFRGLPVVMGWGDSAVIAGTVIWLLLHGKRFLVLIPLGIFILKLWLSGFWIEAIAFHIIHNCFFLALFQAGRDLSDDYD